MTFLPLLLIFKRLIDSQNILQLGFLKHLITPGKYLIKLLSKCDLREKIIASIKHEGSNLNTMTITLKFVVSYDVLSLTKHFQGSCFGHAFFKACQYALIDEKICKGLKYVFVKTTQFDLQKCIIWSKKSGKGRQE